MSQPWMSICQLLVRVRSPVCCVVRTLFGTFVTCPCGSGHGEKAPRSTGVCDYGLE
jgi:hypothetical protein